MGYLMFDQKLDFNLPDLSLHFYDSHMDVLSYIKCVLLELAVLCKPHFRNCKRNNNSKVN